MRGVLMHCQKASGIGGTGDKGQKPRQMPIGLIGPFLPRDFPQIWNHFQTMSLAQTTGAGQWKEGGVVVVTSKR
jgi:hypothetical protein